MLENLVSIIMPTYNSEKFIDEAIQSVISQTYRNWELLITDDCSHDNTVNIVKEYAKKDLRIKLFVLDKNSGAGIARNNSIKNAQGRYIAFLDSDDRWKSNKLEVQLSFMIDNNYAFVYSSYLTCNEQGKDSGIIICRKEESFSSIKKDDKIGFLTVIYDTAKLGKTYLPSIRKRQDWALKMELLERCNKAYGIKEPLAVYRIRNNSISSNKKSLIKYNIRVYQEILGWSKIYATLYLYVIFIPNYFFKTLRVKYINS